MSTRRGNGNGNDNMERHYGTAVPKRLRKRSRMNGNVRLEPDITSDRPTVNHPANFLASCASFPSTYRYRTDRQTTDTRPTHYGPAANSQREDGSYGWRGAISFSKFFQQVALSRIKRVQSSIRAFAINDEDTDTLSPLFQNFCTRHCNVAPSEDTITKQKLCEIQSNAPG